MATVSLLASISGSSPAGLTPLISISEGDYIIAFVASNGSVSIYPESSGPPNLSLLASATNNPTIDLFVFGALVASSNASFRYTVSSSSGFSAVFYRVVPASGESLSVVNTINTQKATYPTSISVQTSQDPKKDDAVFGFSASQSSVTFTDTDTTNGSWSSRETKGFSESGSTWYLWGQYKEVTGTGQQTYDGSYASGSVSSMIVTVSAEQRTSYWGIRA